MPIGKNKKRLVAYVLNATSEAIITEAKATGKSASKIAGKILDEIFKPVVGDVYKMGIDPYAISNKRDLSGSSFVVTKIEPVKEKKL